jgi:hypothetical protein
MAAQCRQRVRHGVKVTRGGESAWVTDTCHARGDPPFDAELQNAELTLRASSIMHYFSSMSLPWLAARIFLLTTRRITQHVYWNVFVQYNLIWGLGMAIYCQGFG